MPMRVMDTRVKHHMVTGMAFPMPASSVTRVRPVFMMTAPAARNRVSFTREWNTTCNMAPTKATGCIRLSPNST